ncbi:MAG: glycosyl transferase [Alphaproteobacteria bacterium]|nr:MAG: glycosyl transferase [Alphaproteobacteria bacterium]
MRAMIYVQHLLGIGHLARVSRIAVALAGAGMEVVLVSGGTPILGFPSSGVRLVQLPPIRSRDMSFSALVDAEGGTLSDEFKAVRRDRLIGEFDAFRPDILIVEAFPFGRRQMRFELLPLLRHAKTAARPPLIASSVRDILQENRKPGRGEETLGLVRDFFDLVLVHGDPNFVRIEDTFPLAAQVADRLIYTGLVAGERSSSPERYDVVVSAGGGIVGRRLIAAAAGAANSLIRQWPLWCIITGPQFPTAERTALAAGLPSGIVLETFRPDFAGLLANARLSISQAGYNTVCDILRARCRAILIPFAEGGETEQSARAHRLETLGIATVVREDQLTPESLSEAMKRLPPLASHKINLEGAAETARIVLDRLATRPKPGV